MKYSEKYNCSFTGEQIEKILSGINAGKAALNDRDALMRCYAAMDLTTLKSQDTEDSVRAFVRKINEFSEAHPEYPAPASVCVFSNFASVVSKEAKPEGMHTTVVSACFPTSQSFLEVKLLECALAVRSGADEVDIVLALNSFLCEETRQKAFDEIVAVRQTVDREAAVCGRKVILKVILETGLLKTPELIAEASFLAMEAGADFIKTSTGKVEVNATPQAAAVMCGCIAAYYAATGRKVGFKAAGGISAAGEALLYYSIVRDILGDEWTGNDLFRLGVSRLWDSLVNAIGNCR
ncbi:MAG: deoxyribose-phosphate aldolase [Bacteroidales bacterium]|nr:deoxyribose-phosphate aldolase [Bacteroidales bacterium]